MHYGADRLDVEGPEDSVSGTELLIRHGSCDFNSGYDPFPEVGYFPVKREFLINSDHHVLEPASTVQHEVLDDERLFFIPEGERNGFRFLR